MKLSVYKSPDDRLRTESYSAEGGSVFCLAETTAWGTLVSKFKTNGEIVDRVENEGTKDAKQALMTYFNGIAELHILETPVYQHVKAAAVCTRCGAETVERELDQHQTKSMREISVVPIFVCKKCGTKYYSITNEYVKNLISKHDPRMLFKPDEIAEMNKDESKFVNTLVENIIRIFASKKIQKLNIKG